MISIDLFHSLLLEIEHVREYQKETQRDVPVSSQAVEFIELQKVSNMIVNSDFVENNPFFLTKVFLHRCTLLSVLLWRSLIKYHATRTFLLFTSKNRLEPVIHCSSVEFMSFLMKYNAMFRNTNLTLSVLWK